MGDLTEKEIRIRATADGSQAKAELGDLNATLGETAAAEEAASSATAAATEIELEAAAAEERRAAVLEAQAAQLAALEAAEVAAGEAVAAMADAADAGGKKYQIAIAAAADATSNLEIAIDAVRASGGPVSPAMIEQLEVYDVAVAAATVGTEGAAKSMNLANVEAGLLKGNISGVGSVLKSMASSTGSAASAFASLALPIGAVIGVVTLLPALLEKIAKGWDSATTAIGGIVAATPNATRLLDEHGKVVDPLSDKYQKLADNVAEQTRAQAAMDAGLVISTDNMAKNVAAVELAKTAIHGWSLETAEAQKALKEFGLKVPPTFDQIQQSAQAFLDGYAAALKKGSANAYDFLTTNETVLKNIEKAYTDAGEQVPDQLKKLGESIGVYTETAIQKTQDAAKKQAEAIDETKLKLKELDEQLKISAQSYTDHAKAIEADRQKSIAAVEQTTATTIADLQKQVTETEAAHQARTISDSEYFAKINSLIGQENTAKADGFAKESKINSDAAKQEQELADKQVLEKQKIQDAIDKTNAKLTEEETAQKKITAVLAAQETAFSTLTPKILDTGDAVGKLAAAQGPLGEKAAAAADAHFDLSKSIATAQASTLQYIPGVQALIDKYNELTAAATRAAKAVDSVTGGNGPVSDDGGSAAGGAG